MPSTEVMPGVISLPHGCGHGLNGTRSEIANTHAGVSCNDITDEQFLDALNRAVTDIDGYAGTILNDMIAHDGALPGLPDRIGICGNAIHNATKRKLFDADRFVVVGMANPDRRQVSSSFCDSQHTA